MQRTTAAIALFVAAAAAGYLASSRIGQEALRGEAEYQLGKLLDGSVHANHVRLRLDLGLVLEGAGLEAYPGPSGPGLSAESVTAGIDPLALLLGRFRLRWLRMEGVVMRIERDRLGRVFPPPIGDTAHADARPGASPRLERRLAALDAIDDIARFLLERPELADRVELHAGRLDFIDRLAGTDAEPHVFSLVDIDGTLEHDWLDERARLAMTARLVGGHADSARGASLEASGSRPAEGEVALTLAATDVDLAVVAPYLRRAAGDTAGVTGRLSGVVTYQAREPDHGELAIDWVAREFAGALPIQSAELEFDGATVRIGALLQRHPGKLRLARFELRSGDVSLEVAGVVARPLRESSAARLDARLGGLALPDLQRIVACLPDDDAAPLERLLERVESGRITAVAARGATRLSRWRSLFAGELARLPTGFVLGAEIADFTLGTGHGQDLLTDVGGAIEWSGDRITLRDVTGRWNERPLPVLDFAMDGVSNLFAGDDAHRELRRSARPLEGLSAFWGWTERFRSEGGQGQPAPAVHLDIAELHHPVLRWPVRNTELRIESEGRGTRISVARGRWAGASITGEALWIPGDTPRIAVAIEAGPLAAGTEAPRVRPGDRWAHGAFRVARHASERIRFARIAGAFALEAATLRIEDARADLLPHGAFESALELDLSQADDVGVDGRFSLRDGDAGQIATTLGLPPLLATGDVEAQGQLRGTLRPGAELLRGLSGRIAMRARRGEIRQEIPLLAALFAATEGLSPANAKHALAFEKIEADVALRDGVASCDAFELEGPMRVFARGDLDLARADGEIDAVVGVYLLRHADRTLGRVPLLGQIVSDKGLIGAYFQVDGPWADPEVAPLPLESLKAAIPEVVRAPFKALGRIGKLLGLKHGAAAAPPASPGPAPERPRPR